MGFPLSFFGHSKILDKRACLFIGLLHNVIFCKQINTCKVKMTIFVYTC